MTCGDYLCFLDPGDKSSNVIGLFLWMFLQLIEFHPFKHEL